LALIHLDASLREDTSPVNQVASRANWLHPDDLFDVAEKPAYYGAIMSRFARRLGKPERIAEKIGHFQSRVLGVSVLHYGLGCAGQKLSPTLCRSKASFAELVARVLRQTRRFEEAGA
jgi:hypothetical protein